MMWTSNRSLRVGACVILSVGLGAFTASQGLLPALLMLALVWFLDTRLGW